MGTLQAQETHRIVECVRAGANNIDRVAGLTHRHYKYPARFSPRFVQSVLDSLSSPGDVVLDPYMGGGTTAVEALASGRSIVGSDVNSLAVFVANAKTNILSGDQTQSVRDWANRVVPHFSYRSRVPDIEDIICPERTRNLAIPRARPIKKFLALALASLREIAEEPAQTFIRCALLNAAQSVLNGRRSIESFSAFKARVYQTIDAMLAGQEAFALSVRASEFRGTRRLMHMSAEHLSRQNFWSATGKARLVVTSPPYPGVHILYHRWQVDGRKESPAPYWIAGKLDGSGAAYYNFGSRHNESNDDYFEAAYRTLKSVREVVADDAWIVQLIAFSDPKRQLPRYLQTMRNAGFNEVKSENSRAQRIWRNVPGRSWHAQLKGTTSSAREVVLFHRPA